MIIDCWSWCHAMVAHFLCFHRVVVFLSGTAEVGKVWSRADPKRLEPLVARPAPSTSLRREVDHHRGLRHLRFRVEWRHWVWSMDDWIPLNVTPPKSFNVCLSTPSCWGLDPLLLMNWFGRIPGWLAWRILLPWAAAAGRILTIDWWPSELDSPGLLIASGWHVGKCWWNDMLVILWTRTEATGPGSISIVLLLTWQT